jgi:hypothetical protein
MKKKYLILVFAIIAILLTFTNTFKAIQSIVFSYITPIDNSYIIKKGEWSGEKFGIISFYDKMDSLSKNVIYRDGKPLYKVKTLNKYFNEISVERLEDNNCDTFISTDELTK